jgi:hypothetical protein
MLPLGYDRERALSPKEYVTSSRAGNFNGRGLRVDCAPSLKGGDRMNLVVVAQMIVTGVLLLAFSVEVLAGKLVWE